MRIIPLFLFLISFSWKVSANLPEEVQRLGIEQRWLEIELWTTSSLVDRPESLFGHSLLRVKTAENSDGFTIQFVADLQLNTNPSYLKGIGGGYPFKIDLNSATVFAFETIKKSRGLKKLKLRLTASEIHSLQLVFFQLMSDQKKLGNYYFFARNCSQAIIEFFSMAKIPISMSYVRGKVPVLLGDAFILAGRAAGKQKIVFDLHQSRRNAIESIKAGYLQDDAERFNFILWFLADREFVRSNNLIAQVYRILPQTSAETIKKSIKFALAD
jgi:hypothetical protein